VLFLSKIILKMDFSDIDKINNFQQQKQQMCCQNFQDPGAPPRRTSAPN